MGQLLQNTPVLGLKGDKPTTGLHSTMLVTWPRELSITSKFQFKDSRMANLTNYCKKNGYAKMGKAKYNQICSLECKWHSSQM